MRPLKTSILTFAALIALAFARGTPALAQGPDSLAETYRDWTVRCRTVEEDRRCWMVQSVRGEDGERLLQLEFAVREGETWMGALAPFGLLLKSGAAFAVDGGAATTFDFRTCMPAGCLVEAEPDDALLAAFRRGNRLVVGLVVADDEVPIRLELSLAGFTAAHDRLRALVAAAE